MDSAGAFVHGVHTLAPAALYVPVAHPTHTRPSLYVPAGHGAQTVSEVVVQAPVGRRPGPHKTLHGVHVGAPDVLANETPLWHGVHDVCPDADEVPAAHGIWDVVFGQ